MPEQPKTSSQICSLWKLWYRSSFLFEDTAPHPAAEEEKSIRARPRLQECHIGIWVNEKRTIWSGKAKW